MKILLNLRMYFLYKLSALEFINNFRCCHISGYLDTGARESDTSKMKQGGICTLRLKVNV